VSPNGAQDLNEAVKESLHKCMYECLGDQVPPAEAGFEFSTAALLFAQTRSYFCDRRHKKANLPRIKSRRMLSELVGEIVP
jgi:hypothetical protein